VRGCAVALVRRCGDGGVAAVSSGRDVSARRGDGAAVWWRREAAAS
jgi:hypothetical protein